MEGGLFLQDDFIKFAQGNIMYVSIMSRVANRPNDNLLSKYGFRGFPSFGILDAEGTKIGQPKGRSVESFQAAIDDVAKVADLKKRAAAGDPEAKMELAKMEKADKLMGLLKSINRNNRKEVATKLYKEYLSGNQLSAADGGWQYLMICLQGAIDAKDLKTFDVLKESLDSLAKVDPRVKMIMAQMKLDMIRTKIAAGEEGSEGSGN